MNFHSSNPYNLAGRGGGKIRWGVKGYDIFKERAILANDNLICLKYQHLNID